MLTRKNVLDQAVDAAQFVIDKSAYKIKCGACTDELKAIFHLRAQVFCDELK